MRFRVRPAKALVALAVLGTVAIAFRSCVDSSAYFRRRAPFKGSLVHRDRAAKFVETLRGETTEDSVRLLTEQEQYEAEDARSMETKGNQQSLRVALSSRRTAKVIESLDVLDPNAASVQSWAIYEHAEGALQSTIERILRMYEDKNSPENSESLLGDNRAVCVGLFCVAQHCEPLKLVKALKSLESLTARSLKRIQRAPHLYPEGLARLIKRYSEPDNACKVSLLMCSLESSSVGARAKSGAERLVAGLSRTEIPLLAWDAEVSPFDFVHVHQGVPVDGRPLSVSCIEYTWPASSEGRGCGLFDEPCQDRLVASLTQIVTSGAARPTPAKSDR